MDGLSALGGIGRGVMQGSQFVRQGRADARQQADWEFQQGQRERQLQEQARLDAINQIGFDVQKENPNADSLFLGQEQVRRAIAAGLYKAEEMEAAGRASQVFDHRNLQRSLMAGDDDGIRAAVERAGFEYTGQQKGVDAYGNPETFYGLAKDGQKLNSLARRELGGFFGLAQTYLDQLDAPERRAAEKRKSLLDSTKTLAEIENKGQHTRTLASQVPLNQARADKATAEAEKARTAREKDDGPLSPEGKLAADMVDIGFAPNKAEAYKIIRTDKATAEAVRIVLNSPTAMGMSREALANAVNQTRAQMAEGKQQDDVIDKTPPRKPNVDELRDSPAFTSHEQARRYPSVRVYSIGDKYYLNPFYDGSEQQGDVIVKTPLKKP
jgi:hypothetical protein